MNFKKSFWKISTFLVVVFFLTKPEFIALGIFIDGIGLELLLLLLEVQVIAVSGYYFKAWIKPVLTPVYRFITKVDPYFFIPSKSVLVKFPVIIYHAVPGFMGVYLFVLYNKFWSPFEQS